MTMADSFDIHAVSQILEDPWTSDKLAATMSTEIMAGIRQHFKILAPAVKARILMSFLSVRKNQLGPMKDDMLALVEEGLRDEDSWVQVIANMMSSLPENGILKISGDAQTGVVKALAEKFAKQAETSSNNEINFLSNAKYLGEHLLPNSCKVTDHVHFSLRPEPIGSTPTDPRQGKKRVDKDQFNDSMDPQEVSSPQVARGSREDSSPAHNLHRAVSSRGGFPRRSESTTGDRLRRLDSSSQLTRMESSESLGLRRMENGMGQQSAGKRSRMMAIDFDDAINESKRPRKDEDAERKKQEREDAREQKRQEREEKKKKKAEEIEERKRMSEMRKHETAKVMQDKKNVQKF